jgi:hypothetical protein
MGRLSLQAEVIGKRVLASPNTKIFNQPYFTAMPNKEASFLELPANDNLPSSPPPIRTAGEPFPPALTF